MERSKAKSCFRIRKCKNGALCDIEKDIRLFLHKLIESLNHAFEKFKI